MPLARQNALKPLPTSDSLPTFPSNRSSSKVSLKILLAHGIHVAGGKIQGELEVSVKDRALGLGEIGIELNGTEGQYSPSLREPCTLILKSEVDRTWLYDKPGRSEDTERVGEARLSRMGLISQQRPLLPRTSQGSRQTCQVQMTDLSSLPMCL